MSIHIVTDNGIHLLPADAQTSARNGVVEAMANDLIEGNYGGLDLTSERDVSLHLFEHMRYSARALRLYADEAIVLAQQIVAARGMRD